MGARVRHARRPDWCRARSDRGTDAHDPERRRRVQRVRRGVLAACGAGALSDDPYGPRESLRAIAARPHSLRELGHRPWPIPAGRWIVAQSWLDLLFIHWRVPHELIRGLVPRELTLAAFGGARDV